MGRVVFVVALLQVLTLFVSGSTNLMYILKREKHQIQPSCIAEELERYKAIGWVYPLNNSENEELAKPKTKYLPNIQNDYNCRFSPSDKCNMRWTLKNWQIDETSSKTKEFLGDSRWDDLPTIILTKKVKEFEKRFLVEVAHKNGFSVRSSGPVEVFLCSGWNPRSYPCYYFHISKFEIYFSKFHMFENKTNYTESPNFIKNYKSFSKIISEDEWRNFEVSVDQGGKVILIDKNLNRVVIEHIDETDQITPMYLLIRSENISAWKISENQFIYTKTAQISRMGPQINTPFKDLCISLFVGTCSNCEMTFFYMNGTTRNVLKHVESTNENWIEIKLKQENMPLTKFNLFVETKYINTSDVTEGWWAYDDVRVCHENEVKVTYLYLKPEIENNEEAIDNISCQLINKPSWRPIKLEYDEIKAFPLITIVKNDTSIKLTWNQEDPDGLITYFLLYQGTDDCNSDISNSIRLRSAGFLSSRHSEFTITNLIPKTRYNITISTVLHRIDKFLVIETFESEEPYLDELPIKMHIRPTDTTVNITWEKPTCNAQKGRLIYTLTLSSPKYDISKTVEYSTDNEYAFMDLRPFTLHSIQIWTARNARMLNTENQKNMLKFNFTTLSGVAPSIENAEIYAMGPNTAYLRYELPQNATGIPTDIQVSRCKLQSFAKCRSDVNKIQRCPLWKKKFCVQVDKLISNSTYKFSLSIKNSNSNSFGEEINVTDHAMEKVPSPPENVTYKIEDCDADTAYCNLKVSWKYPYFPNGTIDVFYILLENAEANSTKTPVLEIYKLSNDTFLPTYTYKVQNITYDTKYKLLLQSANPRHRSNFTTVEFQTEDITKYLNQKPKLLVNNETTLVFNLPKLDRRLDSYQVTVVIQDFNTSIPLQSDIADIRVVKKLCHPFGTTWLSQIVKVVNNQTKNVTIKTSDGKHTLNPNTQYCVTFVIRNHYNGKEREVVYYEKLKTPATSAMVSSTTNTPILPETPKSPPEIASSSSYNHLYILLVILLLIPIGFLLYRVIRKRKINKRRQEQLEKENVYETMPFEEQNGLYNRTYDQLIRK